MKPMPLALLLCLAAAAPGDAPAATNFAFETGTLEGWDGEGFRIAPAQRRGPTVQWAACSADRGPDERTGVLHRGFVVPFGAGVLRCTAHVVRGKEVPANENLDVVLLAAGKRVLPKQVRAGDDWGPAAQALPPDSGKTREYIWRISDYVGQTLLIALIDADNRPDCYLVAGGFQILPADEFDGQEFRRTIYRLTEQHRLAPAAQYESRHFIAYSNADEEFTAQRLNNCELIYELFFDHFRQKGFRVVPPPSKMMVAIFDSQAGFEAYVGQRLPAVVTGLYHTKTNRLVVYDYGQNRAFVSEQQTSRRQARRIRNDLERRRYIDTINRRAAEFRTEANIGTVMHEVAHQLSFNCGLLNHDGDVPFWVAEGLATYCEATDNGAWQGIGEPNGERVEVLGPLVRGKAKPIALRDLVSHDDWMKESRKALQAYAQSWALFKMLMEERPAQMRTYLATIYPRRTPDRRLADFCHAFGSQLNTLELRYLEYMKEQVEHYTPTRR
jgi:hypothetical protein